MTVGHPCVLYFMFPSVGGLNPEPTALARESGGKKRQAMCRRGEAGEAKPVRLRRYINIYINALERSSA